MKLLVKSCSNTRELQYVPSAADLAPFPLGLPPPTSRSAPKPSSQSSLCACSTPARSSVMKLRDYRTSEVRDGRRQSNRAADESPTLNTPHLLLTRTSGNQDPASPATCTTALEKSRRCIPAFEYPETSSGAATSCSAMPGYDPLRCTSSSFTCKFRDVVLEPRKARLQLTFCLGTPATLNLLTQAALTPPCLLVSTVCSLRRPVIVPSLPGKLWTL